MASISMAPDAQSSLTMNGTNVDFELFSSLRYDTKLLGEEFNTVVAGQPSPYLLFSYHVDRLRTGATAFEWPLAIATMNVPGVEEKIKEKCDEAVAKMESAEGGLMVSQHVRCSLSPSINYYLGSNSPFARRRYSCSSARRQTSLTRRTRCGLLQSRHLSRRCVSTSACAQVVCRYGAHSELRVHFLQDNCQGAL